jgi:hypothetical protein
LQVSILEEKLKLRFVNNVLFNPGNATVTPQGIANWVEDVFLEKVQVIRKRAGLRIDGWN